MPEYLAPGVFVEEISFRSKTIEGVATSTTGFVGRTHTGPVQYANGPSSTAPRLVTSYTEFESVYGGIEPFDDGSEALVAHAARMFFANGGQRLYIARAFNPRAVNDLGVASSNGNGFVWRARWPGVTGNARVTVTLSRGGTIADPSTLPVGTLIEVFPTNTPPLAGAPLSATAGIVTLNPATGRKELSGANGPLPPKAAQEAYRVAEVSVRVDYPTNREIARRDYVGMGVFSEHKRFIGKILHRDTPEDESSLLSLEIANPPTAPAAAFALLNDLLANQGSFALLGGNDGGVMTSAALNGAEANPDNAAIRATGLEALGEVDDIAIVAAPDASSILDAGDRSTAIQGLLGHAERAKYRIAVVDGPANASINAVRDFRGNFDSKYGALYHPWIEIVDPLERPTQGAPPRRLTVPPSGAVCGIYARNDITRGVHKAPANEVVMGLTRFEININTRRQQVLNPEGINALRFFEGRGNRVWGARTMSSDPEWKYVNVRRLFIYLEHSIDKATQYAVFEPNNERLWSNIRQSVEDFLFVQWKNGALLGTKAEQAFFVRCDRSTMSQNDLDNGRLICLIGVAPVMPAEFVIFRIGQFTATSSN